ncbi:hypothetical protein JXB11_04895 [Candidatus Woesearchaeota archaeon]|nr:hypothetical protein [Candidatus Woesearchaeota archaeon]
MSPSEDLQNQLRQEAERSQQIAQLEAFGKTLLDKEALRRYGNIKAAYPERAMQVMLIIAQLANSGKIGRPLNDDELKHLLKELAPEKKEMKIRRA